MGKCAKGMKAVGKGAGLGLAAIVTSPLTIVGGVLVGLGKGVIYVGNGITALVTMVTCGCCSCCSACCVSGPASIIGGTLENLGGILLVPAIAIAKEGGCYSGHEADDWMDADDWYTRRGRGLVLDSEAPSYSDEWNYHRRSGSEDFLVSNRRNLRFAPVDEGSGFVVSDASMIDNRHNNALALDRPPSYGSFRQN